LAIDAARSSLRAGKPLAALSQLQAYDLRFPRGSLSGEAQILRIESLAAAGQRRQAKALADAYLSAHPQSPYAQRLRSVVGP
jgi:outer membrane protein assembly factor BamD (BamD/ComL family)